MSETEKPAIAITMGDPCGIGPEVVVKALGRPPGLRIVPAGGGGEHLRHEGGGAVDRLPLQIKETDNPVGAGEDSRSCGCAGHP